MSGPAAPYVATDPKQQCSHVYRVTPQDRSDQVCKAPEVKKREPEKKKRPASGCKDEDGKGQVGLNLRFKAEVMELVYPGGPRDLRNVEDKWVYIFRDNKPVAKAWRQKSFPWLVQYTGAGSRACLEGIELDPGPPGNRYIYAFFLSPVELTQKALDSLTRDRTLASATVQVRCNRWSQTVPVSDPLRWAADAHRAHYVPAVEAALTTKQSADDAARFFIASVLDAWIKDGDRLGVANELRSGEPGRFLDDHKKKLRAPWERAEQAGAYVAHCV